MQKLLKLASTLGILPLAAPLVLPVSVSAQEVCGRRFYLTNPTSERVYVTIHSSTKANLSWSPNLRNIDRETAKKIVKATGTALVAGGGAAGDAGAPIVGVGKVLVAAGDPTLDAIYGVYDARMAARTVIIPPQETVQFTIRVPFACRWERRYALSAICPPGVQNITYLPSDRSRDFTNAETLRATVCRG
jgi:hypothetical protein